ncbi:MAG: M1 family peptidase [Sphingobacteriia bacterium]|nr:M1 family peptidase [Sphingobacteriia bacterium]NCC39261.1 M1 family peptidase [Gammaproteobacteria bacterium]
MKQLILATLALLLPTLADATLPIVDHRIEAQIDPDQGTIAVRDTLTLPGERTDWTLLLHAGLEPEVVAGEAVITPSGTHGHLQRFRLRLESPTPVTLVYGGRIQHGREQITEGVGRTREWSRGSIEADGVFLDGASAWYPRIPDTLQTFELKVNLPSGWTAVSQGAGPGDPARGASTWTETHPQDDIYLIAGPFTPYHQAGPATEAQVYLRQPDPALAQRYLDATQAYIKLYSDLIGPYPFAKFALVENFWETGYGMPSFTLLGTRVIRLPFILNTSYPHEILHNWWGNSVYIETSGGNWSEGLTNYLADHLMREQAGEGWVYRREMLKRYADYVAEQADFPISAFRGRHNEASQAIGYGKSAMFFHMLRRQLGDETFTAGLRRFYADQRFSSAGFADLRHAFEQVSGRDLGDFFAIWTERVGAPGLSLGEVRVIPHGRGVLLTGRLEQTLTTAPFPLLVPVLVHQEQGPPLTLNVRLEAAEADFSLALDSAPLRIAVDPWFDVFRALHPGETPVTLSNLFGAERGLILYPARAPESLQRGYRQLAMSWQQGHPGWEVERDDRLTALPQDRPVWLLGWENRWLEHFAARTQGVQIEPAQRRLQLTGAAPLDGRAISPVLTAGDVQQPLGWLAVDDPAAIAGLARKLPHYGKYSYLTFTGSAPDNQIKGEWAAGDSQLVRWLGPRRELPPLTEPPALVP